MGLGVIFFFFFWGGWGWGGCCGEEFNYERVLVSLG